MSQSATCELLHGAKLSADFSTRRISSHVHVSHEVQPTDENKDGSVLITQVSGCNITVVQKCLGVLSVTT